MNGIAYRCSGRVRVVVRQAGLVCHFSMGLLLAFIYRRLLGSHWYLRPAGKIITSWWMQIACKLIGLHVDVRHEPARTPVLMVANHVSWIDIIAIGSVSPGVFVAKSDLRSWPVIGRLSEMSGTRFIERETLSGLRAMVQDASRLLEQGAQVVVFPEGTSTVGDEVLPFSSALFQSAVASRTTVQAITIEYRREGDRDQLAPFIGDDEFMPHLRRLLCAASTHVRITFETPIVAGVQTRQWLAEYTREQIVARLSGSKTTALLSTDVMSAGNAAVPFTSRL